jgi:hypothetical protein
MARPKDPDLERLWRERLRRQSQSGLPVAAFCAREGVSPAAFYYWKRSLAPAARPASPRPDLFVPVRVPREPRQHAGSMAPGVVLDLPHRVRIHLSATPEPEWLARLVATLAELPDREAHP